MKVTDMRKIARLAAKIAKATEHLAKLIEAAAPPKRAYTKHATEALHAALALPEEEPMTEQEQATARLLTAEEVTEGLGS